MTLDVSQLGLAALIAVIIAVAAFAVTRRSLSTASSHRPASTKPISKPLTYRIRGIPIDWDSLRLQSYLSGYFHELVPDVKSLSREIHGGSSTGTATFLGEPPREIALEESVHQTAPRKYLTFDKDFLGITTLYTPPVDDHELE